MAKAPAFTMTISLSDAQMTHLARAATQYIDEDYDNSTFNLAGVDYKQLISDVKSDPKFQASLVKATQRLVNDIAATDLRDDMYDNPSLPIVKKASVALDKAYKKEEAALNAAHEQTLLAGAIKRLEDAGYTVSK